MLAKTFVSSGWSASATAMPPMPSPAISGLMETPTWPSTTSPPMRNIETLITRRIIGSDFSSQSVAVR